MDITEYAPYWEYMRPELAFWFRDNSKLFSRWLRWPEINGGNHANHITLSMIVYEMRIPMTRKKGISNVSSNTGNGGTRTRSSAGSFHFVNVKLSDEDALYLSEQDAPLSELSARICSLGDDGYGLGIKSLDNGQSICVTLSHSAPDDPSITLAIASFGGNVRDAMLATLYKFDHKLSGEFPDSANAAVTEKPRFR